ncbi:hypothetical protein MRX96_003311 [Rhipicephalus microplus]
MVDNRCIHQGSTDACVDRFFLPISYQLVLLELEGAAEEVLLVVTLQHVCGRTQKSSWLSWSCKEVLRKKLHSSSSFRTSVGGRRKAAGTLGIVKRCCGKGSTRRLGPGRLLADAEKQLVRLELEEGAAGEAPLVVTIQDGFSRMQKRMCVWTWFVRIERLCSAGVGTAMWKILNGF